MIHFNKFYTHQHYGLGFQGQYSSAGGIYHAKVVQSFLGMHEARLKNGTEKQKVVIKANKM